MDYTGVTSPKFSVPTSKKKDIAKLFLVIMTTTLVTALVLLNRSQDAQRKKADTLSQTVAVQSIPVSGELEASGVVVALRRTNISPASPGRIRRLLFKEGDKVKAGQLLAVMEDDEQRSRVLQRQAELEGAISEQIGDRKKLRRYERLLSQAVVSPDEVDELRKTSQKSDYRVLEVKERLNEAQIVLDKQYIRAPFSGIITQLFAELSEYVAPATSASTGAGATSTTIAELSKGLEVEAKIPESDLLNISTGQQVRITSNAFPKKVFMGTVKSISPRAVSADNVISFPVRIDLNEGSSGLRPEMNVSVYFIKSKSRNTLAIPLAAVELSKSGQGSVYVYREKQNPERRAVEIGVVKDSMVEIISGLKTGERVFIAPPEKAESSPSTSK